jgi:hypothetical protein
MHVAMELYFRSETDMPGTYSTNKGESLDVVFWRFVSRHTLIASTRCVPPISIGLPHLRIP